MEFGGMVFFDLELRVPDPSLLTDGEAKIRHDFSRDGRTGAAIRQRVLNFSSWLASQPEAAFVGERGPKLCVVVTLWMISNELDNYPHQQGDIWQHVGLPERDRKRNTLQWDERLTQGLTPPDPVPRGKEPAERRLLGRLDLAP